MTWWRPSTASPIRRTPPTRSRPSPACCPRAAPRRSTTRRSNSISTRRTATSPTTSRPTITTPSSCRRIMPGISRRTSSAPAPSSWRNTRPRSAPPSSATTDYWGPKALPDRTEFELLPRHPAPRCWRSRAIRSTSSPRFPCPGQSALLNDPNVEIISCGRSAHQQVHMRTDMAPFTGQAGPARHRALPRPGEDGEGPVPRPLRHRQRQPLRTGLPLDRYRGAAAQEGSSPGQGADGGRRHRRRLQGQADHGEAIWRSRTTPSSSRMR